VTAERGTSIIDERAEATMNSDIRNGQKRPVKAPQSTAELLCLLATYEAYGTGLAWSGCLRALVAKGGER
jgi:hypothetical protein